MKGNAMLKKIISAVLSTVMVLTLPLSGRAVEIVAGRNLTVEEIISSLYERESDPEVKDCALTSSLILTGAAPYECLEGYIQIGHYYGQMAADHNQKSVLLGEGPVYTADSPEGDYILLLGPEEVPTKEKAEYNRMCLNLLYDTVQEVKTATAGMDACHTAEYIYNWILNNVSYEEETTCRTATRLEKRIADCDGMAGLVYIMAMNCGLDVRTVHNANHAWAEVYCGGEWKVVDVAGREFMCPIAGKYEEACRVGCRSLE